MSSGKFELDRAGVRELLRSAEVKEACRERAQDVLNRAGDGYELDTYTGQNRVNAMAWAESSEARRDNLENNTLLKAVGSG